MVEDRALHDGTVVIGNKDGTVRHIPAREAPKMMESADSEPI